MFEIHIFDINFGGFNSSYLYRMISRYFDKMKGQENRQVTRDKVSKMTLPKKIIIIVLRRLDYCSSLIKFLMSIINFLSHNRFYLLRWKCYTADKFLYLVVPNSPCKINMLEFIMLHENQVRPSHLRQVRSFGIKGLVSNTSTPVTFSSISSPDPSSISSPDPSGSDLTNQSSKSYRVYELF